MQVISYIANTLRVETPPLQPVIEPLIIFIVVLTSDRGLCGGFNNNICRFTERWLQEKRGNYEHVDFIFIGRKGADYLKRRDVKPREVMLNLAREISFEMASQIAKRCMDD